MGLSSHKAADGWLGLCLRIISSSEDGQALRRIYLDPGARRAVLNERDGYAVLQGLVKLLGSGAGLDVQLNLLAGCAGECQPHGVRLRA